MRFFVSWILFACLHFIIGCDNKKPSDSGESEVLHLFNGNDLSGWTTWLVDTRQEDPRGVFSVANGMIRISGDGFGYLSTDKAYRNYRLVVEVKWGERNWRTRKGMARDSGIFLHSLGPEGNSFDRGWGAKDRNTGSDISSGAFKAAIECQVMEGEFGGLLFVDGRFENGANIPLTLSARVKRQTYLGKSLPATYSPDGDLETFTRGWIRWSGRDPEWKDEFGFRGRNDVDSPVGEWTRVECICNGDTISVFVNGVKTCEVRDVFPHEGKILLQCEGSEVFFRKVDLYPLGLEAPK